MNSINDGGPAFPRPVSEIQGTRVTHQSQTGMSLRDHFAGQALLGYMMSCSLHDQPHIWAPKMAEYAYIQADAMLAARTKGPTP